MYKRLKMKIQKKVCEENNKWLAILTNRKEFEEKSFTELKDIA